MLLLESLLDLWVEWRYVRGAVLIVFSRRSGYVTPASPAVVRSAVACLRDMRSEGSYFMCSVFRLNFGSQLVGWPPKIVFCAAPLVLLS